MQMTKPTDKAALRVAATSTFCGEADSVKLAEYETYFDAAERAKRTPLSFACWLKHYG